MHSPRVGTAETPPSQLPAGGNGEGMLTLMQKTKDAQSTSCSSLATLGAHFTHTRGHGHGLISGNCRADSALSPPEHVGKEELCSGLGRDTWLWQWQASISV